MSLRTHLGRLGAALADFVYPPHCPGCEAWQGPDDREALCRDCRVALLAPLGPRCVRCGAPRPPTARDAPGTSGSAVCPNCAHWQAPGFSRALVMSAFDGPPQAAVRALKFGGLPAVGVVLGRSLVSHPELAPELADLDLLVPVPLHPARQRERGFNQAEVVARGAAAALAVPVRTDLVRRCRPTRQQARLDAAGRAANVADAFEPGPGAAAGCRLPGVPMIGLVDDVITTGATVSACARALREAIPGARILAVAVASPFRRPAAGDPLT